ncbi:MAG: hypothetical protein ABEL76_14400 [Bradymonadaceae bacterium]
MRRGILSILLASAIATGAWACDDNGPNPSESSKSDASSTDAGGSGSAAGSGDGGTATTQGSSPSTSPKGAEKTGTATTSESGVLIEKPPLEISSLLTPKDVSEVTGGGSFEAVDLPGRTPSGKYNDQRIAPTDGSGYGAGVQLWSFEGASDARNTFQQLKNQYLNVADAPDAAAKFASAGFVSERAGVKQLVFRTSSPPRIAAVSCSATLCKKNATLVEMGKRVAGRLENGGSGKNAAEKGKGNEKTTGDGNDSPNDDSTGSAGSGSSAE